jgi:RimJ/RimL family protein N-acetyltransferase
MLTHAFERMGALAVELRTDVMNTRSRRAIERLGAHEDGVLRAHRICDDGRVRDSVVYSILDTEWPTVRERLVARTR